jgi:hypothetical protein
MVSGIAEQAGHFFAASRFSSSVNGFGFAGTRQYRFTPS